LKYWQPGVVRGGRLERSRGHVGIPAWRPKVTACRQGVVWCLEGLEDVLRRCTLGPGACQYEALPCFRPAGAVSNQLSAAGVCRAPGETSQTRHSSAHPPESILATGEDGCVAECRTLTPERSPGHPLIPLVNGKGKETKGNC